MRRPSILLAGLALAGAVGLTAPAQAKPGDSACVWNNLPPDHLADFFKAVADGEIPNLQAYMPRGSIIAAVRACGIADADVGASGRAFGGYVAQRVAEARIAETTGITAQQLEAAWAQQSPDDVRKIGEYIHDRSFPDDLKPMLDRMVKLMNQALPRPIPEQPLRSYVISRSQVVLLEAAF